MKKYLTTGLLFLFLAGIQLPAEGREVTQPNSAQASSFLNAAPSSLTLQRRRWRRRAGARVWMMNRRNGNWNRRRWNDDNNGRGRRWNRGRRWRNNR
jgi:hypothetical protein